MGEIAYSLVDIAKAIGAEIHGDDTGIIHSIAPIQTAHSGQLSFLANSKYRKFLTTTKASAVIVSADDLTDCPTTALVMRQPYLGFAKAARLFVRQSGQMGGIHPSAIIADGCHIHETAVISANVVLESGVVVGKNSVIGPACVIGSGTTIGEHTVLQANVSIYYDSVIGDHVIIHSGAVIGSDGFGLAKDEGEWIKIPQLGRVVIQNHVEIGANTTIDRGALDDTIIEQGVKLDNQIQIGHNVRVGENTAIAACTGVSGSATIGKHCMIAGMVGFAGHVSTVDHVVITGMTVVSKNVNEPGVYSSGTGIEPHQRWRKNAVRFRQLDEMSKRLKGVEDELEKLRE